MINGGMVFESYMHNKAAPVSLIAPTTTTSNKSTHQISSLNNDTHWTQANMISQNEHVKDYHNHCRAPNTYTSTTMEGAIPTTNNLKFNRHHQEQQNSNANTAAALRLITSLEHNNENDGMIPSSYGEEGESNYNNNDYVNHDTEHNWNQIKQEPLTYYRNSSERYLNPSPSSLCSVEEQKRSDRSRTTAIETAAGGILTTSAASSVTSADSTAVPSPDTRLKTYVSNLFQSPSPEEQRSSVKTTATSLHNNSNCSLKSNNDDKNTSTTASSLLIPFLGESKMCLLSVGDDNNNDDDDDDDDDESNLIDRTLQQQQQQQHESSSSSSSASSSQAFPTNTLGYYHYDQNEQQQQQQQQNHRDYWFDISESKPSCDVVPNIGDTNTLPTKTYQRRHHQKLHNTSNSNNLFSAAFQSPSSGTFLNRNTLGGLSAHETLRKLLDCITNISSTSLPTTNSSTHYSNAAGQVIEEKVDETMMISEQEKTSDDTAAAAAAVVAFMMEENKQQTSNTTEADLSATPHHYSDKRIDQSYETTGLPQRSTVTSSRSIEDENKRNVVGIGHHHDQPISYNNDSETPTRRRLNTSNNYKQSANIDNNNNNGHLFQQQQQHHHHHASPSLPQFLSLPTKTKTTAPPSSSSLISDANNLLLSTEQQQQQQQQFFTHNRNLLNNNMLMYQPGSSTAPAAMITDAEAVLANLLDSLGCPPSSSSSHIPNDSVLPNELLHNDAWNHNAPDVTATPSSATSQWLRNNQKQDNPFLQDSDVSSDNITATLQSSHIPQDLQHHPPCYYGNKIISAPSSSTHMNNNQQQQDEHSARIMMGKQHHSPTSSSSSTLNNNHKYYDDDSTTTMPRSAATVGLNWQQRHQQRRNDYDVKSTQFNKQYRDTGYQHRRNNNTSGYFEDMSTTANKTAKQQSSYYVSHRRPFNPITNNHHNNNNNNNNNEDEYFAESSTSPLPHEQSSMRLILPNNNNNNNNNTSKVYTDDRDRMVYVSWIPKKARSYNTVDKRRMELDLKRRLKEDLCLIGLTKVLLFPPKGVHCKLIFDCRSSASMFMKVYGGDNRSAETEKWKTDLCCIYDIDMHDKFDKTVVKIEWSQK